VVKDRGGLRIHRFFKILPGIFLEIDPDREFLTKCRQPKSSQGATTTLFVLRDIVISHPPHEHTFLTYIIVGTLLLVFLAMLFILIAGVLVFLSSNKTTTTPPRQTDAHTEPRDEVVPVPAT